jgi:hypothetical protein
VLVSFTDFGVAVGVGLGFELGQVLDHLSSVPSLFCFSLFLRWGLVLLPRLASDPDPPTSISCVAGITSVYRHIWHY